MDTNKIEVEILTENTNQLIISQSSRIDPIIKSLSNENLNEIDENPGLFNNNNLVTNINPGLLKDCPRHVNEENLKKKIQESQISLCLYIFIIIHNLSYLLYLFDLYEPVDFSLCLYPILYKNQYYRVLTNYFIHLNLSHYLIIQVFLIDIILSIEKQIGSFLFFILFNFFFYFNSLIYLLLVNISKLTINYIVKIPSNDYDFYGSLGLSGFIFGFHFLRQYKTEGENINFEWIVINKKSYIVLLIIVFYIFNPKVALYCHVSGFISMIFIVKIVKSIGVLHCFDYVVCVEDLFFKGDYSKSRLIKQGYIPIKYVKSKEVLTFLGLC